MTDLKKVKYAQAYMTDLANGVTHIGVSDFDMAI